MLPFILAAVGGYLIGDSLKGKQYADGGMMAGGGEIEVGDKVKAKYAKYHGTVTDIVDDYAIIEYPDGKVKKSYLKDLQKVTLGIAPEYVNTDYIEKMRREWKEKHKMADGGLTESQEELIYAIASEELKEKARKKIKESDAVLAVGYTDYGGTFGDKVLIEYFKKNYPKNIVYERAGYNGQNAILFGEPLQEYLDGRAADDFGDYYMIKEMETEEKEFKEFVKHLKYKKYKVSPNTLDWLLENRSGYYKLEPNGLDFNSEELENELIEEGLIKK